MQIQLQISGLDEIVEKTSEFNSNSSTLIQQRMVESIQENVIPVAKALAPKKSGALADSIEVEASDPPNVILVAAKSYAPYLEFGTKPHTIVAKQARVLHWSESGQDFFAKSVYNPGIEEGKFSFLGPAIQEGMEKLVSDIEELVISIFID